MSFHLATVRTDMVLADGFQQTPLFLRPSQLKWWTVIAMPDPDA